MGKNQFWHRADIAAACAVVVGVAAKATLIPGSGILFMFLLLSAALWFVGRMAGAIQTKNLQGMPKMWVTLVWLGIVFNILSILSTLDGTQPAGTPAVLALALVLAFIYGYREVRRKENGLAPVWVIFPVLGFLGIFSWLTPAPWRYHHFNSTSPYVGWQDYKKGYHLSGGYLIDSAGKQIRPVDYLKKQEK
jgi:hypothetical protein